MQHIRPNYYIAPNNANLSVQKVIEAWNLHKNFYVANVVKYVLREQKQSTPEGRINDLQKAATYIAMEIDNIKKEHNVHTASNISDFNKEV